MKQYCETYTLDGKEYDVWYKILDELKGKNKTLFYSHKDGRLLPTEKWLTAKLKLVSDGPRSKKYLSGFHIMPTHEECVEYLKRFKNLEPKRIAKCIVKNVRPKTHSRSRVYLSEMIYMLPDDVELKKREL